MLRAPTDGVPGVGPAFWGPSQVRWPVVRSVRLRWRLNVRAPRYKGTDMITKPKQKVVEAARVRLGERLARLARLIELKAPDAIIASECLLVGEAGKMLSLETYLQRVEAEAVKSYDEYLGLCEGEGCEEPVAWAPSAATPTCPGPFHMTECLAHALVTEARMRREDAEVEAREGEKDDVCA